MARKAEGGGFGGNEENRKKLKNCFARRGILAIMVLLKCKEVRRFFQLT